MKRKRETHELVDEQKRVKVSVPELKQKCSKLIHYWRVLKQLHGGADDFEEKEVIERMKGLCGEGVITKLIIEICCRIRILGRVDKGRIKLLKGGKQRFLTFTAWDEIQQNLQIYNEDVPQSRLEEDEEKSASNSELLVVPNHPQSKLIEKKKKELLQQMSIDNSYNLKEILKRRMERLKKIPPSEIGLTDIFKRCTLAFQSLKKRKLSLTDLIIEIQKNHPRSQISLWELLRLVIQLVTKYPEQFKIQYLDSENCRVQKVTKISDPETELTHANVLKYSVGISNAAEEKVKVLISDLMIQVCKAKKEKVNNNFKYSEEENLPNNIKTYPSPPDSL